MNLQNQFVFVYKKAENRAFVYCENYVLALIQLDCEFIHEQCR